MKKIILIILLLYCGSSYANDCIKLSKSEIVNIADLIVLGQILEVNETDYKVKVLEVFKGNPSDTLVGLLNHNVNTPQPGSLWLLYAQSLADNKIIADACSGSKSFDWPHGPHDITFPAPPPPDILDKPSQMFILEQVIKDGALHELYFEIMSLRFSKMNLDLAKTRETVKDLSFVISKTNKKYNILMALMISTSIVLIVGVIILYKKL